MRQNHGFDATANPAVDAQIDGAHINLILDGTSFAELEFFVLYVADYLFANHAGAFVSHVKPEDTYTYTALQLMNGGQRPTGEKKQTYRFVLVEKIKISDTLPRPAMEMKRDINIYAKTGVRHACKDGQVFGYNEAFVVANALPQYETTGDTAVSGSDSAANRIENDY